MSFTQQYRQIGEVPWTRDDLRGAMGEFAGLYARRPIQDNTGGMKSPHMFAVWFVTRWLQPKVVVESGVYLGQSTWLLEQAAPDAELICIEPVPEAIRYRSTRAEYHTEDFSRIDWSNLPREETLLFFDDHQDAVKRVAQVRRAGFRHAMFEDNYPTGHGDCYSLKTAMMGGGFVPPELREAGLYRRLRNRLSPSARRPVQPGSRNARILAESLDVYYEFPPVYRPPTTRWADAWTDERYPTPEPVCDWEDGSCPDVFRQEAQDYTWLCYVKVRPAA